MRRKGHLGSFCTEPALAGWLPALLVPIWGCASFFQPPDCGWTAASALCPGRPCREQLPPGRGSWQGPVREQQWLWAWGGLLHCASGCACRCEFCSTFCQGKGPHWLHRVESHWRGRKGRRRHPWSSSVQLLGLQPAWPLCPVWGCVSHKCTTTCSVRRGWCLPCSLGVTASSCLQNVYAPEEDPELRVERYERLFEQNEELGLNDMQTEGYEAEPPSSR